MPLIHRENPRLLYLTTGLGTGGAEQILATLAKKLKNKGYSLLIISLLGPGFHGQILERHGIKVVTLNLPRSPFLPLNFVVLTKAIRLVLSEIRAFKPDIIHTWMYPADLFGGLLGRLKNLPVVWGIFSGHTKRKYYPTRTYCLLRLCGWLASTIPKCVVSCSAFGRRTHSAIGYPAEKSVYIPTGFPDLRISADSRLHCKPRPTDRDSDTFRIGMLGRYTVEKSHDLLIRTVGALYKQYPRIRLILAGGQGIDSNNEELMAQISKYGSAECTTLCGRVDSIENFFEDIDLFVLLSESEGLPTVIGEAMSFGLPCIASDVGDSRILLKDSAQLLTDNSSLSDKILYLMKHPSTRQNLGHANHVRIKKLFSDDLMANRYHSIYHGIQTRRDFKK